MVLEMSIERNWNSLMWNRNTKKKTKGGHGCCHLVSLPSPTVAEILMAETDLPSKGCEEEIKRSLTCSQEGVRVFCHWNSTAADIWVWSQKCGHQKAALGGIAVWLRPKTPPSRVGRRFPIFPPGKTYLVITSIARSAQPDLLQARRP